MKITVKAIGVNRADVFYRQGKYPVTGLELAGIGEDGKRYASIIDGGAFAPEVEVEEGSYIELPQHFSFEDGAAIIEALYTSYYNLVVLGKLKAGESVLIHGGASGVGVVAIQLAKLIGAKVFATSGKPEKLKLIEELGAVAIDYNKGFGENAYDVILDIVGASYWEANLKALKKGGRLAIISFIGGAKAELNLAPLLLKNISVFGSTIRSLSNNDKWQIRKNIMPIFGKIKPIIDLSLIHI
jgi:NADPH:quinone reductase-like Zn-dependent oxidoreductase